MKFRKKSEIFDAEQYKPGMEDGFNYYRITGEFLYYLPKDAKTTPRVGRRPVLETPHGKQIITTHPPDYIVTNTQGERYSVKEDLFWMTYEKVED